MDGIELNDKGSIVALLSPILYMRFCVRCVYGMVCGSSAIQRLKQKVIVHYMM